MNTLILILKEVVYLGAVSSVLILIILMIKKIFNKALSPKWHYYIWILLLIRLLIPYYPESSMSIYSLLEKAAEKVDLRISLKRTPLNRSSNNILISLHKAAPTINEESSKPGTADNLPSLNKETSKYNSVLKTLVWVWLTGMTILGLYAVYMNAVFAVKIHKSYIPLEDERINNVLENCRNTMRIKNTIPLLSSEEARAPALYGFFNAKILVSKPYMEQLTDAEIKYIFLHELSHYKRKDIVVNWILVLLQIVYFLNPLIWYAFKRIHEDCEIACDASALKYISNTEYESYGTTIIKLLRLLSESNFIPATAGISKNKSSYKKRILMISGFKKSKWAGTLLALILIVFVGFVGLTSFKPSAKTNLNNTVDVLTTPQVNNSASTVQNKEVFYGEWVINKVLAYGSAGTYSSEAAEGLIGKTLSFSAEKASFFGDMASDIAKTADNPVYDKTVISGSDFVINNRMTFDKLGIKADSILGITVSASKGYVCTFLVKDNNTLVIFGGGTYFELVRQK